MAEEGPESADGMRRRKARSIAIALGLGALVVIFYAATIVRLGPNAVRKDGLAEIGAKKNFSVPDKVPDKAPDGAACKKAGTC